jgi:hypothetical protein
VPPRGCRGGHEALFAVDRAQFDLVQGNHRRRAGTYRGVLQAVDHPGIEWAHKKSPTPGCAKPRDALPALDHASKKQIYIHDGDDGDDSNCFFLFKKKKNKKCLYVRSENSSEGRQVRNEELEKVSSLLMFNLKRERGWLVLCSETDEGRAFQKRARTRGGSPHENVQDQFMRERERLTLDTLLRFHEHGIHTTSRLDSILSLIKAVPAGKTEFQWLVQSANDMFSAQNRSLLKPNVKYGERALCFNFFVLSCYRAITKPWLTRKVLHEFILKGGGDRKEPLSSSKKLSMQSFEHLCFLNQCGWWIGPSKSGSDQFSDFEFKRTVTTMLNFLKIDNSLDLKKHGQMPMDVKTQIEILLFNDDIECARFRALMFILLIEDESSRIARSKHNAQVTSTQRSKMTMIDRLRLHMHYSARAEVPYLFRVQFDMKTNR